MFSCGSSGRLRGRRVAPLPLLVLALLVLASCRSEPSIPPPITVASPVNGLTSPPGGTAAPALTATATVVQPTTIRLSATPTATAPSAVALLTVVIHFARLSQPVDGEALNTKVGPQPGVVTLEIGLDDTATIQYDPRRAKDWRRPFAASASAHARTTAEPNANGVHAGGR